MLQAAALVLAAGSGSRFDQDRPAAKLLADLHGQALLAHVLDAVREFGPLATVVVLGHGAAEIEPAMRWMGEIRVVNRHPGRGLASSLQVGIRALVAHPESFDGAFIVLGDQPHLRPETMHALVDAAARARPADRPIVAPRYTAQPGPRNPVLLLRPAWTLVDELVGDHGLASLIEQREDMVLSVPVQGAMPDVDTPADLEQLRSRDSSP
jgi:molybdenum cofactor cytidylyltransferase